MGNKARVKDRGGHIPQDADGWTTKGSAIEGGGAKLKDSKKLAASISMVASLAKAKCHHPGIFLHSWNRVRLTISTHAVGGLSISHLIPASGINALP